MPTYEDPKRDADELAETARALAYATRFVDTPADTYEVLGALHLSFTRLQQGLVQLAAWHQSHREDAATDDGDRHTGNTHTTKAAAWLSAAAAAVGQAADTVMAAQGENGHIAWRPVRSTVLSEVLEERAAALDPVPSRSPHGVVRGVA
ncbi:hypothetical protein [Microbacterium sp. SORGH_AS_0888]|uniref:hypothetical protein n=1 Tax=Microbacterium sp. SORGH_AS_0888 TaxID=3041791 RepID=UPI00278047CF|nr:hypothetical protein [Microbacterium sp. SORGH_AS_0888]MDQ1128987.1 hypothetical protein [Microbacterium sp. SORGH_AS_0888]